MPLYRFDIDIWMRHVPVEVSADSEIAAETALTLHAEDYVDPTDIQDGWAIHINRIEEDQEKPFNEEQPIIDAMERYGDDDGDPTRYDEDDPMYRGGPNEDMSWLDDEEDD